MASKIDNGVIKMRVYRLTESLRESIDETRTKRNQTLEKFITESVERELPAIATLLLELGIEKQTDVRPARWPLESTTLRALGYAAIQTGVPANALLLACLHSACKRGRRKRTS